MSSKANEACFSRTFNLVVGFTAVQWGIKLPCFLLGLLVSDMELIRRSLISWVVFTWKGLKFSCEKKITDLNISDSLPNYVKFIERHSYFSRKSTSNLLQVQAFLKKVSKALHIHGPKMYCIISIPPGAVGNKEVNIWYLFISAEWSNNRQS